MLSGHGKMLLDTNSANGFLLVLAIALPASGVALSLTLGGRGAQRLALAIMPAGLAVALAIAGDIWRSGEPLTYLVGGWHPPLGIALRADGLSAVMLLTTAVVIAAVCLYARGAFGLPAGAEERRAPLVFWTMLMGIWSGLNAVWLAGDLFSLYVALELLTFSAVPLVSLDGSAETLQAALRYLLFALIGSVLYLLGTALLYGAYGTLDLLLLSGVIRPEPTAFIAASLMTAGLIAKTALFPLHLWLPPAHAGAPAAASALLSALVVKGSFILIVRLWFEAMPGLLRPDMTQTLGTLGAAAIIFGSVLALRQARLKLMIAYSTIAQIGYLFFLFPLASAPAAQASMLADDWNGIAWTGGLMQLVAHAVAKAAMFMAAGVIAEALGHDRIAEFAGLARTLPITMLAFGLGGMSLMGLPPSGGFVAKAMLLVASVAEGQWWWAVVILLGGLLAASYMFRVFSPALAVADMAMPRRIEVSRTRQSVVLGLAICAMLLGLVPLRPSQLLEVGRIVPVPMRVGTTHLQPAQP
jgi:formate hydrogenlyase subunit 3/multisubunit Na+/H+ antiporter MnhD subunit